LTARPTLAIILAEVVVKLPEPTSTQHPVSSHHRGTDHDCDTIDLCLWNMSGCFTDRSTTFKIGEAPRYVAITRGHDEANVYSYEDQRGHEMWY
jgi:hypothetical protein